MTSKLYPAKQRGWWVLRDLINEGHAWHNSHRTFRGEHNDPHVSYLSCRQGWMSEAEWNRLVNRHKLTGIDYLVYSYNTVIAYRTRDGKWHVPAEKYSRTTTFHQQRIGVVADQLNKEMENAA